MADVDQNSMNVASDMLTYMSPNLTSSNGHKDTLCNLQKNNHVLLL